MATPRDRACMQLAQALTRADSAVAREHISAALAELTTTNRLVECCCCGRSGLEARMVCIRCAD